MKKAIILVGILAVVSMPLWVTSAPRLGPSVTKTYLNEGNNRAPLAVAVTSATWATVLSANSIRRSAILHTLSTATDTICLSTTTTASLVCVSTMSGVHLEPGGTFIDNSEAILYGKLADTVSGTVYIYGMEYTDTGD